MKQNLVEHHLKVIVSRGMDLKIIIVDSVETIHRKIDHSNHMVALKRAMISMDTRTTPCPATAMAASSEKGRGQVRETTLKTAASSRLHPHLRGHPIKWILRWKFKYPKNLMENPIVIVAQTTINIATPLMKWHPHSLTSCPNFTSRVNNSTTFTTTWTWRTLPTSKPPRCISKTTSLSLQEPQPATSTALPKLVRCSSDSTK